MAPIQINLAAFGSNGTGIVPTTADETAEAPDEFLVALTSAFKRRLAKSGPAGNVLRAWFGK